MVFTEHFAVEENTDSRRWHRHLSSHPCSCPPAFTASIRHFDFLKPFFLCVCVFGFFYFFPFFLLFNHFSSFLQRNSHWLSACRRLRKSSGTRGMVSFFHLAADLVEIIFPTRFFFYYKNKKMLQLSVLQGVQKSLKGQHKHKVLRYENLR